MKNILYRMLPICLFTISLTGCEDETKYRPLPEAVPYMIETLQSEGYEIVSVSQLMRNASEMQSE